MHTIEDTMKPILLLVAILLIFGALSYCHYEPGTGYKKYVTAEIISHARGGSGKAGADPAHYVVLPSGIKTFVRDWGELPAGFKGKVVLQVQSGELSGKPIYKVDQQRTKALHNK